jgi:hypothetical protein
MENQRAIMACGLFGPVCQAALDGTNSRFALRPRGPDSSTAAVDNFVGNCCATGHKAAIGNASSGLLKTEAQKKCSKSIA